MEIDAVLNDDAIHSGSDDITAQVVASGEAPVIPLRLGLALPRVAGGIAVEDWGDDRQYTMN
jgi:hypothetical protein